VRSPPDRPGAADGELLSQTLEESGTSRHHAFSGHEHPL